MYPPDASLRRALAGLGAATLLMLGGCAAPPAPVGVTELMVHPAEHQLLAGLRLYDDARYAEAEQALKSALSLGLASRRDQAAAYKTLAFIECTHERLAECEEAFRAARAADPAFALSRAEAGHPIWGPVYTRSLH